MPWWLKYKTWGPNPSQRTLKPWVKSCLMIPKCVWFCYVAHAEIIPRVSRISEMLLPENPMCIDPGIPPARQRFLLSPNCRSPHLSFQCTLGVSCKHMQGHNLPVMKFALHFMLLSLDMHKCLLCWISVTLFVFSSPCGIFSLHSATWWFTGHPVY